MNPILDRMYSMETQMKGAAKPAKVKPHRFVIKLTTKPKIPKNDPR